MSLTSVLTRRQALARSAAAAALTVGFPNIIRANENEIFVGGPASPGLQDVLFPLIEQKHGIRILFEGSNSLINLEKIRSNAARQTMTVTMMDDPVLILALRDGLITPLFGLDIPNLADIQGDAKPMDSTWVNWCQPFSTVAFNTDYVPEGVASYADCWDSRFADRIIVLSMRITQAIAPLCAAAHLATGKPLADCIYEADAGFEKMLEMKPNIIQVTTETPQAQQLLEIGECDLFMSPDSRSVLFRKDQGAPVDQARPVEGAFAMPAGLALVKDGPNPELGMTFINEMLNPETQALIAETFYSKPTNTQAAVPPELDLDLTVLDWEYFSDNREQWIERWEREIAA